MLSIERVLNNPRQLRAVTGVTKEQFYTLLFTFERLLHERLATRNRQRKIGGGRKGVLSEASHKLFFVLFYLKVYPTFDFASFIFGADRTRCCQWVQILLPLLEQCLGRQAVLPKRKINSVEEFERSFSAVKDIFVDGTERKTQRSKQYSKQTKNYSGKKGYHTRKNLIACDEDSFILMVSPTKGGRTHDLKCFKKWMVGPNIPNSVSVWGDKGFIGIQKCCNTTKIVIPHKKKAKVPLSPEQRAENKIISGLRIVVEHAIGGIKRMACMVNTYRNRKGQDDRMVLVTAGLWNLNLQMR